MKLEEYKGNLKLTIGDKATLNVVGAAPASAAKPAAQQQKPTTGQRTAPAATGKRPINGATVGMAINQAIGILRAQFDNEGYGYFSSPAFSADLHRTASDIIRVSAYLEAGNLADSAKVREAAALQPEPAPPAKQPEPEPEPTEPEPAAEEEGSDVPF
jgi:hypothetical protein